MTATEMTCGVKHNEFQYTLRFHLNPQLIASAAFITPTPQSDRKGDLQTDRKHDQQTTLEHRVLEYHLSQIKVGTLTNAWVTDALPPPLTLPLTNILPQTFSLCGKGVQFDGDLRIHYVDVYVGGTGYVTGAREFARPTIARYARTHGFRSADISSIEYFPKHKWRLFISYRR